MLAIALCVWLNGLDGFDVLSMSFAAPGIAAEWRLPASSLGIVLSMELIGMAAGALVLGRVADRFGRRPVVLACLVLIAAGMAATAAADTVMLLAGLRLGTGLGIGGLLASGNALVAEHADRRTRGAAVALMAAGFPFGAIVGGSIVAPLIDTAGWRIVFTVGAVLTAATIPLVLWLLPESVASILARGGPDRLARANRTLQRLGNQPLDCLPEQAAPAGSGALHALLRGRLARTTLALTAAYFLHILAVYFLLKWLPKIVVDMGHPPSLGSLVLIRANTGGLAGALLFSLALLRFPLRPLLILCLGLTFASFLAFGLLGGAIGTIGWAAIMVSFWANGASVGLYAITAAAFPPEQRSSGIGIVIGIGRFGAACGPVLGGYLFAAGLSLNQVATFVALLPLAAMACIVSMPRVSPDTGAV